MENCAYTQVVRKFRPNPHAYPIECNQKFFNPRCAIAPQVSLCRQAEPNAKMAGLMAEIFDSNQSKASTSVYAIEAVGEGFCKVGISAIPLRRRAHLQNAHYAELKIGGLVWTEKCPDAEKIERLVLRAAREMGIHVRGEWLATDASEVLELAIKAARHADVLISDSAMAMNNLTARVNSLYSRRRQERAYVLEAPEVS